MSVPGASCGIVCETGILLMIETTWEFHNAAWLVCFPGSCIVCAAIELPNRPSEGWSPESKRKIKKRQPLVQFKPHFWACHDGAPPPVPMVSLERSYVREVLASPFCEGWGWGRIATPARIVPSGLVLGYSGRA